MTKKVNMFGRNSLERAQNYIAQNPDRTLILMKDTISQRYAVCSPALEDDLRSQGFIPVETEG